MRNPYLIGDHLYLRPVDRADAPTLQPWFNDPTVRRTISSYRPLNLEGEQAKVDHLSSSAEHNFLLIVERTSDRAIGATGLHNIDPRNRHAELGLLIGAPADWGKGFATEASRLLVAHGFETLNLHRIYLTVYEDNPAGQRVYEKVGFRREGIFRQHAYREGRYWDIHTMAILRDEWDQLRAPR